MINKDVFSQKAELWTASQPKVSGEYYQCVISIDGPSRSHQKSVRKKMISAYRVPGIPIAEGENETRGPRRLTAE